jgi:hypothetical protein
MKNRKEQNNFKSKYRYMPLNQILEFEQMMIDKGVSKISRTRGFLKKLKRVKGVYDNLGYVKKYDTAHEKWLYRRENFIARNLGAVKSRGESHFVGGEPTRRTLSLYAWGFNPDIANTRRYRVNMKRRKT